KFFLNTLILLELRKECVKIAISFYIKGLAQPIPKKLGNRMKKLEHRVTASKTSSTFIKLIQACSGSFLHLCLWQGEQERSFFTTRCF
ncbi:MAG: hypothetical protein V1749_01130, partial [Candidatus Desantisbacteria bacterium]